MISWPEPITLLQKKLGKLVPYEMDAEMRKLIATQLFPLANDSWDDHNVEPYVKTSPMAELQNATSSMKICNAAGIDTIPPEPIKIMVEGTSWLDVGSNG